MQVWRIIISATLCDNTNTWTLKVSFLSRAHGSCHSLVLTKNYVHRIINITDYKLKHNDLAYYIVEPSPVKSGVKSLVAQFEQVGFAHGGQSSDQATRRINPRNPPAKLPSIRSPSDQPTTPTQPSGSSSATGRYIR